MAAGIAIGSLAPARLGRAVPGGHRRGHLMNDKIFHSSLTRTTDFERAGFDRRPLPREQWEAGDYVVATATIRRGGLSGVELTTGRMVEAVNRDMVLGALGVRLATLEAVGSWEAMSADGRMHLLSGGPPRPTHLRVPHARIADADRLRPPCNAQWHESPDAGFCASSDKGTTLWSSDNRHRWDVHVRGQTTSAKVIVRQLKRAGHRVVGTKLSGAGRLRDILAMKDAGALLAHRAQAEQCDHHRPKPGHQGRGTNQGVAPGLAGLSHRCVVRTQPRESSSVPERRKCCRGSRAKGAGGRAVQPRPAKARSKDRAFRAVGNARKDPSSVRLVAFAIIATDEVLRNDWGIMQCWAEPIYGQGSSREQVALTPRFLGLSVVIMNSLAPIHWQNLVNFGVVPLDFIDDAELTESPSASNTGCLAASAKHARGRAHPLASRAPSRPSLESLASAFGPKPTRCSLGQERHGALLKTGCSGRALAGS